MSDRAAIVAALGTFFERSRIVFWYDDKRELRELFEEVELAGVEKVELENNEFGLKRRMLREEPEQKFLVYREGARPENIANWLLDVELANQVFRTDQVALWVSEMDLQSKMTKLVASHQAFYKSEKRKQALKELLAPDDKEAAVRMKMLAVVVGGEPRMDMVAEHLLSELAEERDEKWKLIERCGLEKFLWSQLERCYGYRAEEPGLEDFAIELFKSCYAEGTQGTPALKADAQVFLGRWMDSRRFSSSFETLSLRYEEVLKIEDDLGPRDFRDLLAMDQFRVIDLKILHGLVEVVSSRTAPAGDVATWVRQRRQTHWFREFKHLYSAIDLAAQFIHGLEESVLGMDSLEEGFKRYTESWCRLDRLYRKFIFHVREAKQSTLMADLVEQVENLYVNNYLLPVNDRWQELVDAADSWEVPLVQRQDEFYSTQVDRFLRKDKKVCVLVSDALRYEIADDLAAAIRREDKYTAEVTPMLSMLPSYTQLGMAALLPNKALELKSTSSVLVDGMASQKTVDRGKILDGIKERAAVVQADAFGEMNNTDRRTLYRDHDVVYVYHNLIDAVGDKRDTEQRVCAAVDDAVEELVVLVKQLMRANFTNLIVTADHGFIYQDRLIGESDFLAAEVTGAEVASRNRRFVVGTGLDPQAGLHHFTAKQLGLSGEQEVMIPKSINRLRRQGSGSRFVHGGATLQEVVIPVISINKSKKTDVSTVEVDIVQGGNSVISTGQLAVMFYQCDPATAKVRGRTLRAGIYSEAGELISNSHDLEFHLESENPRERETRVQFLMTRKADALNGQEVLLKLEEFYGNTSHPVLYKSVRYMVRRKFTNDFDL